MNKMKAKIRYEKRNSNNASKVVIALLIILMTMIVTAQVIVAQNNSENETINETLNQSINETINESINISIDELENQSVQILNLTTENITEDSVIINWETNESATTNILYGTTPGELLYEFNDETMELYHIVQIMGLLPNMTYYYKTSSTNIDNETTTSEEQNFTTSTDSTEPTWENISTNPSSQIIYGSAATYQFSVDWHDDSGIDFVTITHNFTGIEITENVTMDNQTFTFTTQDIPAGTYNWYMEATDLEGNTNRTPNQTYEIQKAEPTIELLINGQESDLEISENTPINIYARSYVDEGEIALTIEDEAITKLKDILEINTTKSYENTGMYLVNLSFNETQNYTQKEITLTVNVTKPTLQIYTNKEEYELGEEVRYNLIFPEDSVIDTEVCGPIPAEGVGFVECFDQPQLSGIKSPYTATQDYTKQEGDYLINAEASYQDTILSGSAEYSVNNNLDVQISGDTKVLENEDIKLKATATGGIAPYTYTWKLSNTTVVEGRELKLNYKNGALHTTKITVTDSEGNEISKTFDILVQDAFDVKITVKDKGTKKAIQDAEIKIRSETALTDEAGVYTFKLPKGNHDVEISADGYNRQEKEITVDGKESIIFELNKKIETSSDSDASITINLINPKEGQTINTKVYFEAQVKTDKETNCELYIVEQGASWSKLLKSWAITQDTTLTHSEDLEKDKEYSWYVSCKTKNSEKDSETRTFTTSTTATTSFASDSKEADLGDLRTKLEQASNNIASLDLNTKQVAESLELDRTAEFALRDYDRVLRDINDIQFRSDLTDQEKNNKKDEYNKKLSKIQEETPLTIELVKSEQVVKYPKKEELRQIITEYAESQNREDTINEEELQDLQNEILVKTRISQVTLTYIDGHSEDITVIEKDVTFTGNTSKKSFLMEYIPKDLVSSADKITFITDSEILKLDPIIKFDNSEKIVYYIQGHKNIDIAKTTSLILYQESIFTKQRNLITGNVLGDIDFTSPTFFIVLLVIIILLYASYSFEIIPDLSNMFSKNNEEKMTKELVNLIKDIEDKLNVNDLNGANLIFKELRINYENAPFNSRKETYPEIAQAYNRINIDFFRRTIKETDKNNVDGETKFKVQEIYKYLPGDDSLIEEEIIQKYKEIIAA